MTHKWLISPPAVFGIIFFTAVLLSHFSSKFSFKSKRRPGDEGGESYACGESNYDHMAQPDYTNFFSFAFFFTLAHVATLIMNTVPTENLKTFALAAIYICSAIVGLYVLFRK